MGAHSLKTIEEREPIITEAKRLAIAKDFAELRMSEPDPPMVLTLGLSSDLENDRPPSGSDDDLWPAPRSSTPIVSSNNASTRSQSSQAPLESPSKPLFNTPSGQLPATSLPGPLPDTSSPSPLPASFSSGPLATSCCPGTVPPSPASRRSPETQPGPSDNNNSSLACPCKCLELVKRVEALERKLLVSTVEASVQLAPVAAQSGEHTRNVQRTPVSAQSGEHMRKVQCTPVSAQKGDHVRKASKEETLYKKVIDDFEKFRVGPRIGRKDRDNAQQAAGHCLRFCQYMVGGLTESCTMLDLRFLARMDKLRNYPVYLKNKGYMPTTVKNMLANVTMFYKHIQHCFLRSSRLQAADIGRILHELKRIQADIRREVVVRGQQVKRSKTANQLDSAQELAFLSTSKKRIPQVLNFLSKDGNLCNEHARLMGYIMGSFCIISGHRSVVLTNMLTDHERDAECWADSQRYQILVIVFCITRLERWARNYADYVFPASLTLSSTSVSPTPSQINRSSSFLSNMGMHDFQEPLAACLCGKEQFVRLDKPLQDTHKLESADEREPLLKQAKRNAIVKQFVELRESDPETPMVSTLDLGNTHKTEGDGPNDDFQMLEDPTDGDKGQDYNAFGCQDEENDGCQDEENDGRQDNEMHSSPSSGHPSYAGNSSTMVSPDPMPHRSSLHMHHNTSSSSDACKYKSRPLPSSSVSGLNSSVFSTSGSDRLHSTPLQGSSGLSSHTTNSSRGLSGHLSRQSDHASSDGGVPSWSLPGHLSGGSDMSLSSAGVQSTCSCNCLDLAVRLKNLEQKVKK